MGWNFHRVEMDLYICMHWKNELSVPSSAMWYTISMTNSIPCCCSDTEKLGIPSGIC